jgi:hypothetical protein
MQDIFPYTFFIDRQFIVNPSKKEANMKKRLFLAMVVAVLLLTTGMTASAKSKYPNLLGTWSGTVNFVGWNSSSQFYYVPYVMSYEIQNEDQNTGNFYGFGIGPLPFTGNVTTGKIVTIIEYGSAGEFRIITGKVTGNKMTGTMQHFKSDQVDTGTFTFFKQ